MTALQNSEVLCSLSSLGSSQTLAIMTTIPFLQPDLYISLLMSKTSIQQAFQPLYISVLLQIMRMTSNFFRGTDDVQGRKGREDLNPD